MLAAYSIAPVNWSIKRISYLQHKTVIYNRKERKNFLKLLLAEIMKLSHFNDIHLWGFFYSAANKQIEDKTKQQFGQCVLQPSSGIFCQIKEPIQNFESCPLLNPYWPIHCQYNNKDEDFSPKTMNDKNHQASSQKFKQLRHKTFFFNSGTLCIHKIYH